MVKTTRENFVNQSFLYFVAAIVSTIISLIFGLGYLALNYDHISFLQNALKLVAIVASLAAISYVLWRSYLADKKLLTSSKDKHIETKSLNINTQGIDYLDSGNDS